MIKDFLKQLEIFLGKGVSLEQNCPPDLLSEIAKSKDCQEAVAQLSAVAENESLPSLIGRGKNIIEIYRDDTWQISMVRQSLFGVEPFLVSSPNPVLVYCIAGEGTSKLCYYKINGDPEALSSAKDWTLSEDRVVEIEKGSLFSCQDPNQVLDFNEIAPSHIFLRFVHKPIAPLLFVFDRETGNFSYHTFSDEVATGHFFFADLILNMVNNPDCRANFSDQMGEDLVKFSNAQIGNEAINMKARWRLVQALGMIAEGDAINWLKKFSNHPDPGVSQLAGATLAQFSDHGEGGQR